MLNVGYLLKIRKNMDKIEHFGKIAIECHGLPKNQTMIQDSLKILEQYRKKCHSVYGIFSISDQAMEYYIKNGPLSIGNDQDYISFGSQFPDAPQVPGKSIHASMLIGELKNIKLIDYLTQLYIVFIYQLWETHFRQEIANKISVDQKNIKCDFFGDLRIIRNRILHNQSEVSNSDIKNLKIIKWNLTPGTLKITNEMFGHLMEQLNSMHVRVKIN